MCNIAELGRTWANADSRNNNVCVVGVSTEFITICNQSRLNVLLGLNHLFELPNKKSQFYEQILSTFMTERWVIQMR